MPNGLVRGTVCYLQGQAQPAHADYSWELYVIVFMNLSTKLRENMARCTCGQPLLADDGDSKLLHGIPSLGPSEHLHRKNTFPASSTRTVDFRRAPVPTL